VPGDEVKAAAWDELREMTFDEWRSYTEQWEESHPVVERGRVMDRLLAKHKSQATRRKQLMLETHESVYVWTLTRYSIQAGNILEGVFSSARRAMNEIEEAGWEQVSETLYCTTNLQMCWTVERRLVDGEIL